MVAKPVESFFRIFALPDADDELDGPQARHPSRAAVVAVGARPFPSRVEGALAGIHTTRPYTVVRAADGAQVMDGRGEAEMASVAELQEAVASLIREELITRAGSA